MKTYNFTWGVPQTPDKSIHDNTKAEFAHRAYTKTSYPSQRCSNNKGVWSDAKQYWFDNAIIYKVDKHDQRTFSPNTFDHTLDTSGQKKQKKIWVDNRNWITVDVDKLNHGITATCGNFKDYVFGAWPSFNNTQNKGDGYGPIERFRICLPLDRPILKAEWENKSEPIDMKVRVNQWLRNHGIACDKEYKTLASVAAVYPQIVGDWSAMALTQVQYAPSISHLTGDCTIIINDDIGTEFVKVDDLLALVIDEDLLNKPKSKASRKTSAVSRLVDSSDSMIELVKPENEDRILDVLTRHKALQGVESQPKRGSLSRISLAAAWSALGLSEAGFRVLDKKMRTATSSTDTDTVWAQGSTHDGKHPGVLLDMIGKDLLVTLGVISVDSDLESWNDVLSEKSKWDNEIILTAGNYYSPSVWGSNKRVLVKGGLGIGKNHCFNLMPKFIKGNTRYIVLTSLRNVCEQSAAERSKHIGVAVAANDINDANCNTFTYDKAGKIAEMFRTGKWNPMETVLIIDECHNLVGAAGYRRTAISQILDLISDWGDLLGKIVFQSGTVDSDYFAAMRWDYRVVVKKDVEIPISYTRVSYEKKNGVKSKASQLMYLTHEIDRMLSSGIDKIVILNNSKNENRAIRKLYGSMVCAVDALTSKAYGSSANDLITTGISDCRIIIGTYSVVEGVSIQDAVSVGGVIVVGNEPAVYIKQICGRLRKAGSISLVHLVNLAETPRDMEKQYANWTYASGVKANTLLGMNSSSIDKDVHITNVTNICGSENNAFIAGVYYDVDNKCYKHYPDLAKEYMEYQYCNDMTYNSGTLCDRTMQHMGFDVIGCRELCDSDISDARKDALTKAFNTVHRYNNIHIALVRGLLIKMWESGIDMNVSRFSSGIVSDVSDTWDREARCIWDKVDRPDILGNNRPYTNSYYNGFIDYCIKDGGRTDFLKLLDDYFNKHKTSDLAEYATSVANNWEGVHGWIKKSYSGSWIAANKLSEVIEVIVCGHVIEHANNNPGMSLEKAFKTVSNWDVFKAIKKKGFLTWDSAIESPICSNNSKKIVSAYLDLVSDRMYVGKNESGSVYENGYLMQ